MLSQPTAHHKGKFQLGIFDISKKHLDGVAVLPRTNGQTDMQLHVQQQWAKHISNTVNLKLQFCWQEKSPSAIFFSFFETCKYCTCTHDYLLEVLVWLRANNKASGRWKCHNNKRSPFAIHVYLY